MKRIYKETFTFNGKTLTLNEWAEQPECVVKLNTLKSRLLSGWGIGRAVTTHKLKMKEGILGFVERGKVSKQ